MGLKQFLDQSLIAIIDKIREVFFLFSEDIWTSLISVHRLDLRLRRCRFDLRAKIWCARSGERRGTGQF